MGPCVRQDRVRNLYLILRTKNLAPAAEHTNLVTAVENLWLRSGAKNQEGGRDAVRRWGVRAHRALPGSGSTPRLRGLSPSLSIARCPASPYPQPLRAAVRRHGWALAMSQPDTGALSAKLTVVST